MVRKLSAFILLGFIVAMQPLAGVAQQTQLPPAPQPPQWYWPGPWHMWGDGYGYGWQFWWLCPAMMLFMFLVCAAVFFARRSLGDGPHHHWGPPWRMMDRAWSDPSPSALQILSERFARGEIQKDEYEEKKAAIFSGR